jgi:hypothetical protein
MTTEATEGTFRFRLRFRVLGGHVHCRVFQRRLPGETWQKNGDLVYDAAAWAEVGDRYRRLGFDVLPEEESLDEMALVPDCTCRFCGHPASRHRGAVGACMVPGCECGPGGWT